MLLTMVGCQQFGMALNNACHFTQRGLWGQGTAGELGGEFGKQPGAAQATTADHHTVATRLVHHGRSVGSRENIAITQHRDSRIGHVFLQPRDLRPVGLARVSLRRRAGVKRHRRRAFRCGNAPGIQVGFVGIVNAHAELHRHWNIRALRGANGSGDDIAKQFPFIGQC